MISARDLGPIATTLLTNEADGPAPRVIHAEGPRRYTAEDVAITQGQVLGRQTAPQELPRPQWIAILAGAGLGPGYAALVSELYDAHNAGTKHPDARTHTNGSGSTGFRQRGFLISILSSARLLGRPTV